MSDIKALNFFILMATILNSYILFYIISLFKLYPILLIASSFRLTKHYSICNQGVTTLIIELQSRWVGRVLSGKVALPSEEEMASSVEELYQHMEESGWPKCHTHQLQNKVSKCHIK